jgi:3-oxoacyl-[acyl-carrier-protein] synthase II
MKNNNSCKRRVVVTGIGVVTPIGNNVESYCDGLKKGKCGIGKITTFDVEKWKYKYAAEIKNFDPKMFFSKKELRRMDKASQIALVATEEAIISSKIDFSVLDKHKIGVCLGTTLGGTLLAQKYYKKILQTSNHYVSLILDYPLYSVGTRICAKYKLLGPNIVVSTACSSSNVAMSCAYNMIKFGQADIVITGGFDTVTELTCAGFGVLRNVAKEICRPFDKNRDGLILGEAAGILVFEELQHAIERKANIFAEILGFGMSSDAYHLTAPDVSGNGPARAIKMAVEASELDVSQIDYINAHGTGTLYNDLIETRAIKKVFKEQAYKIPVSSTKSMIGHTLGACGAVELIATILAIKNNFVPPTINYETPDPECDLDYVPNFAREKEVNVALSNTFGFGGNNCSIVVSKYIEKN